MYICCVCRGYLACKTKTKIDNECITIFPSYEKTVQLYICTIHIYIQMTDKTIQIFPLELDTRQLTPYRRKHKRR